MQLFGDFIFEKKKKKRDEDTHQRLQKNEEKKTVEYRSRIQHKIYDVKQKQKPIAFLLR
jgi:hypothetical protein